jgi:hypothetical protein
MGLKEIVKKDIDDLNIEELLIISEQIKLLKKSKALHGKVLSVEEIRKLTATSKSNWADDVIKERQERG